MRTPRGQPVAVLPPEAYGGAQRCQRGVGCWDPRSRRVVHTSKGARSASPSHSQTVTFCPPPPHVLHERGSTGARRRRWPPTLGLAARTPEALDGPPAHRLTGFVVR